MPYRILQQSLLGKPLEKEKPYTIIGAGIAGLLLGFHLKEAGFKIRIVEKSSRPGGLLGTQQLDYGLAEQAANGFLWCPEMQHVCDVLQLEITPHRPLAKSRYLLRDKKLYRYPLYFRESLELLGRMLLPHHRHIKSVRAFGDAYGGKAFSRQLLAPAFNGIYGADIGRLSFPGAATMLAKLLNHSSWLPLALLKNHLNSKSGKCKSVEKLKGTCSFKGGMQDLIDKLYDYLQPDISLNTNGLDLKNSPENLLVTIPANMAAGFFEGRLNKLLRQVEYTSLISATLIFRKSELPGFKPGFGCLIPKEEGMHLLGILFNSCIFEYRVNDDDLLSITCMLQSDGDMLNKTDANILELIQSDLHELFGASAAPLDYRVFRWPQAIPLYSVELYESWFEINDLLGKHYPNRNLFGNYTGEISIRGMCQMAAKAIEQHS